MVRDFEKLLAAQTVAFLGIELSTVAIPLIAVTLFQATPSQVGFLVAAQRLPYIIFGLIIGVWIDRISRHSVLIFSNLGRAIVMLTMTIGLFLGWFQLTHFYVVVFVWGTFNVFFGVAYQAYLPALVDATEILSANGRLETSRTAAQVFAPSMAGVFLQVFSAWVTVAVDAMTGVMAAVFLFFIKHAERIKRASQRPVLSELREGFALVIGDRPLLAIAGFTGTYNFFYAAISAMYVVYFTRDLHMSPGNFGVSLGIGNAGALIGAAMAAALSRRLGVKAAMIGAAVVSALGFVPILFATPLFAFAIAVLSRALVSFALPVFNINSRAIRQLAAPDYLQARAVATMRFLTWGPIPVGSAAGGLVAAAIGVRSMLWVAVFGAAASALWFRGVPFDLDPSR